MWTATCENCAFRIYEDSDCLFADSECPDQTAHRRSLIRAFAIRLKDHWVLYNVSSDRKDQDEIDLNLHLKRMHENTFSELIVRFRILMYLKVLYLRFENNSICAFILFLN